METALLFAAFTAAPVPADFSAFSPTAERVTQSRPDLWTLTTTYRQPTTHTHTCSFDHTWDHKKNAGHVCTEWVLGSDGVFRPCGASQFTVDQPSRMVSVQSFDRVTAASVSTVPATAQSEPVYRLPASPIGSGCGPNGCPTTTYERPGLFRRR